MKVVDSPLPEVSSCIGNGLSGRMLELGPLRSPYPRLLVLFLLQKKGREKGYPDFRPAGLSIRVLGKAEVKLLEYKGFERKHINEMIVSLAIYYCRSVTQAPAGRLEKGVAGKAGVPAPMIRG